MESVADARSTWKQRFQRSGTVYNFDKGKTAVRRGRKARGPKKFLIADQTDKGQILPEARIKNRKSIIKYQKSFGVCQVTEGMSEFQAFRGTRARLSARGSLPTTVWF